MSEIPEKTQLEADLKFINTIQAAVSTAVLERQQVTHAPHPDLFSGDLKQAMETLDIRKMGILAKLRRFEILGR